MKTKNILAVLLSLLLLCTVLFPVASAAEKNTVIFFEAREYQNSPAVPENIDTNVDWNGVKEALEAGIIAHAESIDLSAFGISNSNEDNVAYIANIIYDSPKLLGNSNGFSRSVSGGTIKEIYNKYIYTAEEFAAMFAACEDAVTQLLYGIKGCEAITDAEKCLLVHDRLALWCEYDYRNYLAGSVPDASHSAYGPLVLHTGVCQGISYAFDWMMDELGIDSCYISSDTLNHGWNMVTIGGEKYFIDNTNDDPVWDVPGFVLHNNLLLSFDTFSARHKNAADFTNEPSSALYENAWWSSLRTGVQFINGAFWYLAPSAGGDDYFAKTHFDLIERKPDGTETVKKTAEAKWTTADGAFYRSENAMLTAVGDMLLYTLPDEVRAYNTVTGEDTPVYAPDLTKYGNGFHIYGLNQINGTLSVVINDTPNFNADTANNTCSYAFCTDHTNREELEVLRAATAGDAGEAKYICTDCRAIFTDDAPICNHTYGAWTVTVKATCTQKGAEKRVCKNCAAFEIRETATDKTAHTFRAGAAAEATCTKAGYTVYVCEACSATETRDTVNALGHAYNNGVCTRCGEKEPEHSVPSSGTSFLQKMLDFFRKIADFFKNLFN